MHHGRARAAEVFTLILANLGVLAFEPEVAFGSGENAAMFGKFRSGTQIQMTLDPTEWFESLSAPSNEDSLHLAGFVGAFRLNATVPL